MTSIVSSNIVYQQPQQKPENWDSMVCANMVPAHVSSEYLRRIREVEVESENEVAGMESENEGSENGESIPKKTPTLISKKRERETTEPCNPYKIRDEFSKQGIELVTRKTYKKIIRPKLLNADGNALLVLEKRSGRSRAKGDFVLFEDGSKAFEFIEVLPGTTYQGLLVLVARTRDGVIPSLNKIATAYNQLVGNPGAKSAPLHFFGNNYQENPLYIQHKYLLGCKERTGRNNKKSKVEQSNE